MHLPSIHIFINVYFYLPGVRLIVQSNSHSEKSTTHTNVVNVLPFFLNTDLFQTHINIFLLSLSISKIGVYINRMCNFPPIFHISVAFISSISDVDIYTRFYSVILITFSEKRYPPGSL